MKTKQIQKWTIRLKVSPEERKKIHKDAIDLDLSIAEYIKLKLLEDGLLEDKSITTCLTEGKSA